VTSYIDVLIAKRNLFDAELSLTETHRLHLVSVVQLYKALGGGWSANDSSEQQTLSRTALPTNRAKQGDRAALRDPDRVGGDRREDQRPGLAVGVTRQ